MWENPASFAAPEFDPEKVRAGLQRQQGKKIGVQQLKQTSPAELSLGDVVGNQAMQAMTTPDTKGGFPVPAGTTFAGAGLPGDAFQQQIDDGKFSPAGIDTSFIAGLGKKSPQEGWESLAADLQKAPVPQPVGVSRAAVPQPGVQVLQQAVPVSQEQLEGNLRQALTQGMATPPAPAKAGKVSDRESVVAPDLAGNYQGVETILGPKELAAKQQRADDAELIRQGRTPSLEGYIDQIYRDSDPIMRQLAKLDPAIKAHLSAMHQAASTQERGLDLKETEERNKATAVAAQLQGTRVAHEGQENKELNQAGHNVFLRKYDEVYKMTGNAQLAQQEALKERTAFLAVGKKPSADEVPKPQVPNEAHPDVAVAFDPASKSPLVVNGKVNVDNLIPYLKGTYAALKEDNDKQGFAESLVKKGGGYIDANKAIAERLAESIWLANGRNQGGSYNGWTLRRRKTKGFMDTVSSMGAYPFELTSPSGQVVMPNVTFASPRALKAPMLGTDLDAAAELPHLTGILEKTLNVSR